MATDLLTEPIFPSCLATGGHSFTEISTEMESLMAQIFPACLAHGDGAGVSAQSSTLNRRLTYVNTAGVSRDIPALRSRLFHLENH